MADELKNISEISRFFISCLSYPAKPPTSHMHDMSVALLINPSSVGRRRYSLCAKTSDHLRKLNIDFDLYEKVWPVTFEGRTHILLIGGDGTINYFINKYPDNTIPVSLIKGGTGNDFAWKLLGGLSIAQQLEAAINGTPSWVDAGVCNGRYFLNGVGVGFDGAVVEKMNKSGRWFKGYFDYYLNVLKVISTYRSVRVNIAVAGPDEGRESEPPEQQEAKGEGYEPGEPAPWQEREERLFMITVANGSRYGGNFIVAPGADVSDGLLDLVLIKPVAVPMRYFHLPGMKKGKHLCLPFVSSSKIRRVIISSEVPLPAHLDGEYIIDTRFDIEVLPRKFVFRI